MRESLPGLSAPRRAPLGLLLAGLAAGGLLWLLLVLGPAGALPAWPVDPGRGLAAFSTVFLGIFIEAVPFLLLGTVVSAALHLFVSEARLARLLPRQPVAASLVGALLGLAFPVCECGTVPVSRRLLHKGAAPSLGVAFLLAAPVVNPVVIASTWVAFGGDWRMVAARVGLTIVIAAAIGLVFAAHPRPAELLVAPPGAPGEADHTHDHRHDGAGERARALLWHSGAEFVEISRYLILGALLAAAMQAFVPRSALLTLGATPPAAVLVMMALAVVLSICSTVDAFVALSFAGTFGPGALLAFLVFGPMIDVKSTLMFTGVFRRRAVAVIVMLAFQMTLLAALAVAYTWG